VAQTSGERRFGIADHRHGVFPFCNAEYNRYTRVAGYPGEQKAIGGDTCKTHIFKRRISPDPDILTDKILPIT
jgi:hypothetical protein